MRIYKYKDKYQMLSKKITVTKWLKTTSYEIKPFAFGVKLSIKLLKTNIKPGLTIVPLEPKCKTEIIRLHSIHPAIALILNAVYIKYLSIKDMK